MLLRSALTTVFSAALLSHFSQAAPKVDALYQQHCAVCHGKDLSGGLGSSFLDDDWEHGGEPQSMFDNIKYGLPEYGMQPFDGTLTDAQINALVIYIREKNHQAGLEKRNTPRPEDEVIKTQYTSYRLEPLIDEELKTPWSMVELPDGRFLVTERGGTLHVIENGKLVANPVEGIPQSWEHGQGGLLDINIDPNYAENGWIYLGYTTKAADDNTYLTTLARGRLKDMKWVDNEVIFKADDKYYSPKGPHYGTRIVFDKDGFLFFSIGDRGFQDQAQDLTRPNGKVHRIRPDGSVPEDNPFRDIPGSYPTLWTYGNRNPQGLAFHPATGELWETEHGPRGGDELNLIRPGINYGWPVITYGMNYNGSPLSDKTHAPGMEQPVHHWTPSIAVCGLDFYTGSDFPEWENDIFIGSLRQEELWRFRLEDGKPVQEELVLKGAGRIRDVYTSPEGHLYLVLNDPGLIMRLVPVK